MRKFGSPDLAGYDIILPILRTMTGGGAGLPDPEPVKIMVNDLVPAELCGTAYGTCNATLGLLELQPLLIAGLLWQGIGPSAPSLFGAGMALIAAVLMILWRPRAQPAN